MTSAPPPASARLSPGQVQPQAVFLEADGLGGFSSSTLGGLWTDSNHGLVVVAKDPPAKRYVLLSGFEVRVVLGAEVILLDSLQVPAGSAPQATHRLLQFDLRPWPSWRYDLGNGRQLEFECLARHGSRQFVFSWQLTLSDTPAVLRVRPLFSGRPVNAARAISPRMDLRPRMPSSRQFVWSLRTDAPDLTLLTDGLFHSSPWESPGNAALGLASPGEFEWQLLPQERAHIVASADEDVFDDPHTLDFVAQTADKVRKAERTRRGLFRSEMDRAADQYVVSGRLGCTVLSGYPSGEERGAEAMMAVRGIALSPGRLDVASDILATWRARLAAGLLPSSLSEHQGRPSYDSAAPSLWYVISTYEYIQASYRNGRIIGPTERAELESSILSILENLSTRRHRHVFMDEDLLIAEAGDRESASSSRDLVKRAHIQALWMNALRIGARFDPRWLTLYASVREAFPRAFWNPRRGHLFEAVIARSAGPVSRQETLTPDQILAVGGLPITCLAEDKASLVVQALELHFQQSGRFPWQFGSFVQAWFRVHYRNPEAKELVLRKFIAPWERRIRTGVRTPEALPDRPEREAPPFSAVETTELLRILHLPELETRDYPFGDSLSEPMFYGSSK